MRAHGVADDVRDARPVRHAADGQPAPRPLPRRAEELGPPAGGVSVPVLRRRLARAHHRLRKAGRRAADRARHGDRLARRRRGPEPGDAVRPVAGARARRAAPAAVDDDAARLARARADLQGPAGKARRQGPVDLRLSRLSAAAVGRHPDLSRPLRPGGRGPGAAHRVHARGRRGASIISTGASRASRTRRRPR